MSTEPIDRSRQRLIVASACIALPILAFYTIALRHAVNIPTLDDYDCALEFVTRLSMAHSFHERLMLMVVNQHNEYRTLFSSAIFWLQYALFGKLNFALSSAIGDVFSAGMALVLWFLCLPQVRSLSLRLAVFVPAALLIFQLNYAEALDAPMTSLQHQPAVTFALFAIMLLVRGGQGPFCVAVGCLLLSIFSSTNGFLLLPVGLAILVLRKRYLHTCIWIAANAVAVAIYRYHYIPNPQAPPSTEPFLMQWLVYKPAYMFSVVGAAVGPRLKPTYILGIILVVVFAYLVRRGYFRRHEATGYCAVFLGLTALGIAHIRFSLGMQFSTSSRYRMYSDMLLAIVWFAIAEEYILHRGESLKKPLHRNWIFVTATALTALFAIGWDWKGDKFLHDREQTYISGLSKYEHPAFPGDTSGLLPDDGPAVPPNAPIRLFTRRILADGVAHHVYSPPQYPERIEQASRRSIGPCSTCSLTTPHANGL